MENTTATTRVSMDFRVIPGSLWDETDHYSGSPGYYVKAVKQSDEGGVRWVCAEALPDPDARNGFPFTNK